MPPSTLGPTVWEWLETQNLSMHIGETWWFPLLESIHVLSAAFVVGSILMVDLRLLGVAARSYSVRCISTELVPWTWMAFAVATITGAGLFITRASSYIGNRAMQAKVALLLLAGVNMLILHFVAFRSIERWDAGATTSGAAKAAGSVSILLWIGVMLSGRWVGHLS